MDNINEMIFNEPEEREVVTCDGSISVHSIDCPEAQEFYDAVSFMYGDGEIGEYFD